MKPIVFGLFMLMTTNALWSQNSFLTRGKVTYEKRTNLYKYAASVYSKYGDNIVEQLTKDQPKYLSTHFDLYFDDSTSFYEPTKTNGYETKIPEAFQPTVKSIDKYLNLESATVISRKDMDGRTVLIRDRPLKIDWHLSNETRDILGYKCRKATAVIFDSLFVVAFYSEQIVLSSGPESITGLPGMIMGMAIPRLNTTWFAISLDPSAIKHYTPGDQGKSMNEQEFEKKILESFPYLKESKLNFWQCIL